MQFTSHMANMCIMFLQINLFLTLFPLTPSKTVFLLKTQTSTTPSIYKLNKCIERFWIVLPCLWDMQQINSPVPDTPSNINLRFSSHTGEKNSFSMYQNERRQNCCICRHDRHAHHPSTDFIGNIPVHRRGRRLCKINTTWEMNDWFPIIAFVIHSYAPYRINGCRNVSECNYYVSMMQFHNKWGCTQLNRVKKQ